MKFRWIGCLVAAGITVALSGCGSKPIRMIAGIDASESNSFQLGGSAYLCSQMVSKLHKGTDLLGLFRIDDSLVKLHNGPRPESTEQFQQQMVAQVRHLSKGRGTRSDLFWTQSARLAGESKEPTIIVFFTDGYMEDCTPAEIASVGKAASVLAKNPHVLSVTVAGAVEATHTFWNRQFAPLGARFHLSGPVKSADFPALRTRLDEARN